MYAIVEHNTQQLKVKQDMSLVLDRMNLAVGETFTVDNVLLLSDAENSKVCFGMPNVEGASVKMEVVEHMRGKKILITKFKRRKNYLKRQGHRQDQTTVKVVSIDCAKVSWD